MSNLVSGKEKQAYKAAGKRAGPGKNNDQQKALDLDKLTTGRGQSQEGCQWA
jgi:hypothetical protein